MMRSWAATDPRSRYNLIALTVFFLVLLLFGGASRADEIGQPVVRIAATLLIASSLLQMDRATWHRIRLPALFLIAVAALIGSQLIPLPEPIWRSLPGRELFVEALRRANIESTARPLSLTPDLTLNSLLAMLPPIAVVLCLGLVDRRLHVWLVPTLLVGVAVAAVLGVMQVATGGPYLYRTTNIGSAVGAFANRNHQALFLAIAFPLLAAWAVAPRLSHRPVGFRSWLATCCGVLLVPLLLVTGSRLGLLIGFFGMIVAGAIVYRQLQRPGGWSGKTAMALWTRIASLTIVAIVAIVSLFVYSSRAEAIRRVLADGGPELRGQVLPTLLRMMADFFPVGSGFGSFDPVYRAYEPIELLVPSYLNHAHNDFVQVVIEGGVLAAILVVAFLSWLLVRSVRFWRQPPQGMSDLLGQVGSAGLWLIVLSSVFDYPLRTPTISVIAVVLSCWLLPSVRPTSRAHASRA